MTDLLLVFFLFFPSIPLLSTVALCRNSFSWCTFWWLFVVINLMMQWAVCLNDFSFGCLSCFSKWYVSYYKSVVKLIYLERDCLLQSCRQSSGRSEIHWTKAHRMQSTKSFFCRRWTIYKQRSPSVGDQVIDLSRRLLEQNLGLPSSLKYKVSII